MGLSIAKQLVELHGGRILVDSTFGKGSTFIIEIPTASQAGFHERDFDPKRSS
ncbi:MAG TPA: ATP-binding protein [Acidobacteriota bacterium]|nr:ATP-binding protein [Acidobacteriota bacterium]